MELLPTLAYGWCAVALLCHELAHAITVWITGGQVHIVQAGQ